MLLDHCVKITVIATESLGVPCDETYIDGTTQLLHNGAIEKILTDLLDSQVMSKTLIHKFKIVARI